MNILHLLQTRHLSLALFRDIQRKPVRKISLLDLFFSFVV